jgi:hypothetical protein
MPEDEEPDSIDEEEILPADVMTCEGAKKEILRLMEERQALEQKLLEEWDKKSFKEKKRLDRTIRNLFQDYAGCNIEEEPPQETTDSSTISPDHEPPA